MRQFIEISGSCIDKKEVTIRQVHEVGGKLIVFAHLSRRRINDQFPANNHDDMSFRDQVVVDTDAQETLPVTYVLMDVDPEEVGASVEKYLATHQLRGVNRFGYFELVKLIPYLPKQNCVIKKIQTVLNLFELVINRNLEQANLLKAIIWIKI
jgi:hypothetical protein